MPTILLLLALQTQVMGSPVTGSPPTGSVAGVVTDTAGRPLADAVVSFAAASRHARTDSFGRYRLDAVPTGPVDLMAWAYQHKTTQVVGVVRRGGELEVDFVLHRLANNGVIPAEPMSMGSVIGVVRDTAGRPVRDAAVTVPDWHRWARTDSLGQYHLDSVPVGWALLLVRRIAYNGLRLDTAMTAGQPLRLDSCCITRRRYRLQSRISQR